MDREGASAHTSLSPMLAALSDQLVEAVAERVAELVVERITECVPSDERLVTRSGYAQLTETSVSTVDRMIAKGMPVIRIGDAVRIDPAEANTWHRAQNRTDVAS